jgi:hypothetical protein
LTERSPQNLLKAEFELLATYLANAWTALERIYDTVKFFAEPQKDQQQTTANAIRTLHEAVQQLASKVDSSTRAPLSYAAVAGRGSIAATAVKPVPARHKREIIVARDRAYTIVDERTNREYIEQLNKAGLKGQIVAVRSLPSGDLILTTDEEDARTEWLQKTQWLQVLGGRARIKKREFIIIAHGIRVNQVQD